MPWGMGRNRGDRDETEKEVHGSATPKVVSAWSYDGGGGATTPLMLSYPLSRRSTSSIISGTTAYKMIRIREQLSRKERITFFHLRL
ncbi:hypothetical protein WN51_09946 [Melipona quadrifasciata]|uniref:Uncharacterized protein n=1 Tax=Melipona quadrifasciata TaxID=166423 RepID=A0A0N0BJG6_9HYME|nr:hypothetical protein WN51_09946 [Melipona quadrifasciata]